MRARAVAVALWAFALAACVDGYPTEDEPWVDPATLTRSELVEALNALGREPRLGRRWVYALHTPCELEVVALGGEAPARVVLAGAEVRTRLVDGASQVRLVPESGGEAASVTALESRRWSDAVHARALLVQLESRCTPRVDGDTVTHGR